MSTFIENLKYQIANIPGFSTKRKLVVIESDDWGSIRMPSREVYEELSAKGFPLYNSTYNRYDSLASEEDLEALFEVLSAFTDSNCNHPKITANTIVSNPDFEKIKKSSYTEYHYEPFTTTLSRYPKHSNAFELWKQCISAGVFKPQFHGREHINVPRWMNTLKDENTLARQIFPYNIESRYTKCCGRIGCKEETFWWL